jgi:hypothetical protein
MGKREIHKLKILPKYFNLVLEGDKNFEIRKDDRNYKIGDALLLQEYENGNYTGCDCTREILYILKDAPQFGLAKGYCIISF